MRVRPRRGSSPSRLVLTILAVVTALTVTQSALATPTRVPVDSTTSADPLGWRAIAAELNDPSVPWTLCARQNNRCNFTGKMMVRYGLPGTYAYRLATGGIACNNTTFGNPLPGVTKYCAYRTWNPGTATTKPAKPARPIVPASTTTTAPAPSGQPAAAPTVPVTTTPVTTTPVTTTPTTPTTTPPTTPSSVPVSGPLAPIPSNFDVNRYISTGGAIPPSSAADPSGNFRMLCDFSHLSYDDPIVYPGQPGAAHLHMWFGNTQANANSTYSSLRTTGDSTCQGGPANRSAYWAPALLNAAGQVVTPDFISVYYKDGVAAQVGVKVAELPPGLKMIAGYNMAAPGNATHFSWYCEKGTVKTQTIPNCPAGERVGVALQFPSCWDGKNLDSADHRSHMAYFSYGNDGRPRCPTTHPVYLPEFTLGIWFVQDGNSSSWNLSSDRMPGMTHANGTTFHADWIGAWDPNIQTKWLTQCINALRSCSGGELGDGTWLSGGAVYNGARLVAAPPKS